MNRQQKFELTWIGSRLTHADAEIAKNYLSVEELDTLIRIVSITWVLRSFRFRHFLQGAKEVQKLAGRRKRGKKKGELQLSTQRTRDTNRAA
jgi:hypothetical protein